MKDFLVASNFSATVNKAFLNTRVHTEITGKSVLSFVRSCTAPSTVATRLCIPSRQREMRVSALHSPACVRCCQCPGSGPSRRCVLGPHHCLNPHFPWRPVMRSIWPQASRHLYTFFDELCVQIFAHVSVQFSSVQSLSRV